MSAASGSALHVQLTSSKHHDTITRPRRDVNCGVLRMRAHAAMRRRTLYGASPQAAPFWAALLLLCAPRHVLSQAASPPATSVFARVVNAVVQNSPGLSWFRSSGYNMSAIPPDFSANLNFEPTPVQSSSPYIDEALNVADAVMAGAFQEVPGTL